MIDYFSLQNNKQDSFFFKMPYKSKYQFKIPSVQNMQTKGGLMIGEKYLEFLQRQSCVSEQDLIVIYS